VDVANSCHYSAAPRAQMFTIGVANAAYRVSPLRRVRINVETYDDADYIVVCGVKDDGAI
jgi:hypothetical protein